MIDKVLKKNLSDRWNPNYVIYGILLKLNELIVFESILLTQYLRITIWVERMYYYQTLWFHYHSNSMIANSRLYYGRICLFDCFEDLETESEKK